MTTVAPFELHRVTSVAEASRLLDELGDDSIVYSGGTELLLLMKLGFASYGHLVDVKPIAELGQLEVVDGTLVIGGAVTHRLIERSPLVRAGWPALRLMERSLANVRVRNVGSLGGNLAFADPHSDPATFLLAADASLVLGRHEERRTVPVDAFIHGPYQTDLRPRELLVTIEVPPIPPLAAMAHVRFAFHERPAATISCLIGVEAGRISRVRLAVGSVGVAPVLVETARDFLLDLDARDPARVALDAAGRAGAAAADPVEDANGAVDYKRDLVRVLVGRCVREAAARALAPGG